MPRGEAVIALGEAFLETDIVRATARWAKAFEQSILDSPSDWVFMFDKRWRPVLCAAAEKGWQPPRDGLAAALARHPH